MLYHTSSLEGFKLGASDGEIGSVEDFYFDDQAWAVRYLVADTGSWLTGRTVLLTPSSFGRVDWEAQEVEVKLSKEQIKNSPDVDRHKPISRQYETSLHDYYGYPYYWGGPYLWGPVAYPGGLGVPPPAPPRAGTQTEELQAMHERQRAEDLHLRSAREVINYYIEAPDGEIGHVEDLLVEDANWAIRYVVVDTKNWWPGKKVLIAPQWVRSFNWNDSKAMVELSRDKIKNAPEYDKNMPISRDYEERVFGHYGFRPYWQESRS